MKDFYSRADIIQKFDVTYPTLHSWINNNKFPKPTKIGGKLFWLKSTVDNFINDKLINTNKIKITE